MIDPKIIQIARDRIQLEIEEQGLHLRDDIDRNKAEMSAVLSS